MAAQAASKLRDPTLLKTSCYVNGQWVAAKSGKVFSVENPSTLEEVARCPEFDAQDTEAAIAAADAAFKTYRKTPARQRARLLRRWYDLMMENAEDIARLITLENGKPLADGRTEATYAANFFEWFSEEAPRIYGETIEASNPSCLVVKAPAEAPLTALALAELAHRAGIPAGVVNIITALDNTAEVGKVMTTHPTVKKVSFTGSTGVGRILMNQSSSTIKKLSFELGGNAPFIVFEDADLDKAVKGLIACKFRNSGQTCVCANRILVHRSVYDKFVQMVLDVVKTFVVGDGFGEKTTHGPLIHGRAVSKVAEHVQDAISKGAKLVHGGEPLPQLGPNFFNLTLLTDMKPGMKICDEETFGPVAAFFAFNTEEEAIEIANDSEVGLGGYFFSNNVNRCYRVAEALEVGMVGVNVGVLSDPAAPFGGVKQSGFGREGSKYGIDEFTVTKMVMTDGRRNTQNGGVYHSVLELTRMSHVTWLQESVDALQQTSMQVLEHGSP
ncbi:succinate-semialdehyde dehydrogenase [Fusarium albosuccineum]|uniref:Succinate-semialdehyde dehydrogenase, mitochondrial n=1 Tax=Fusarium albosuccineum TaxID=1237068 RepID=A0A8H4P6G8_9HYPO|nr:succinate-semialdehyde dehydrogenase [Fusarium albosuccineum]